MLNADMLINLVNILQSNSKMSNVAALLNQELNYTESCTNLIFTSGIFMVPILGMYIECFH